MRRYGIEVIGEISLSQFSSLTQVSKILSYSALFVDERYALCPWHYALGQGQLSYG
jgi:hypothetical protein